LIVVRHCGRKEALWGFLGRDGAGGRRRYEQREDSQVKHLGGVSLEFGLITMKKKEREVKKKKDDEGEIIKERILEEMIRGSEEQGRE
jgi:hypothetical protein